MEHTPAPYGPRAVYGYAMYISSNMLFLFYMIWALMPDEILHDYLGLTYLPSKYWAVAIPIWALTALATFAFLVYPAINMILTPDIDDLRTITDKHALHKMETTPGGIPPVSDIPITEDNDTDRNDVEDNSPTCSFRTGNHREIMDLRRLLRDMISKHEIFYSFEVVSKKKTNTFYQRLLAEMDKYSPLFYALTWHNKVFANENYLPLEVLEHFPNNTLLHLTAKGLRRNEVISILKKASSRGIINIFALQGDSSCEDGDFVHASDLVAFIRKQFGDTFCICVAGYPQMHPKSTSKEFDLHYLKMKVEAGADFIITQIIFESQVFVDFVKDCREIGIQVPIIPGIFIPTDYKCLELMTHVCKLEIPKKIKDHLSQIRNEDKMMRKFIFELIVQIITDVIGSGTTCGFHLFTLNRLSLLVEICEHINSYKQRT